MIVFQRSNLFLCPFFTQMHLVLLLSLHYRTTHSLHLALLSVSCAGHFGSIMARDGGHPHLTEHITFRLFNLLIVHSLFITRSWMHALVYKNCVNLCVGFTGLFNCSYACQCISKTQNTFDLSFEPHFRLNLVLSIC